MADNVNIEGSITITVSKFQPSSETEPKWWDIGFTLTNHNGIEFYSPTTVYANDITHTSRRFILAKAAAQILPQQVALAFTSTTEERAKQDFFDSIASSFNVKGGTDGEHEHSTDDGESNS